MEEGFGLAAVKRECSIMVEVYETNQGEAVSWLPPPWKKEGYYYVLYDVPEWVKTVLTQPFNIGQLPE